MSARAAAALGMGFTRTESRLKVFTNASAMPLLSGLSTGVKHGTRLSARAISMVLWAAKIDPLSESHCTGCGARIAPKRFSTQLTIMSRIISPETPAVVATKLMTSRSWQSRAKARRTTSPFQQANSRPPEHQRMLERSVATWPSWSRGTSASGMPGQQQAMPLHQPVDALGIDRGQTVGSPLVLEDRGDPPVPVSRRRVDEATDPGHQFKIAITGLRPPFPAHALDTLGDVR